MNTPRPLGGFFYVGNKRYETMNTPVLFAIAAKINRAAEVEVSSNLIPRQTVAFVCEDDGSIKPGQTPKGALRVTLDIERYREHARTHTEKGRTELANEAAAEERILDAARKFGTVEKTGDGSGDTGPINCYELHVSQ